MQFDPTAYQAWILKTDEQTGPYSLPQPLALRCMGLFGVALPDHLLAAFDDEESVRWRVLAIAGDAIGMITVTTQDSRWGKRQFNDDVQAKVESWLKPLTAVASVCLLPEDDTRDSWRIPPPEAGPEADVFTGWRITFRDGGAIDLPLMGYNSYEQIRRTDAFALAVRQRFIGVRGPAA